MLTKGLAKELEGFEVSRDSDSNEPFGSVDSSKDTPMGSIKEGELFLNEWEDI